VLDGLFGVAQRLFGLHCKEEHAADTWHPDVRLFAVYDEEGSVRGRCYIDLYARAHKRGGAWMDECVVRRRVDGKVQTPVAFVTCNFSPPVADEPAKLTHDEVLTLFHEFGHALHHMLSRVDHAPVSGINGVSWDAVELPSQLLENWCWDRSALQMVSGHHSDGHALPDAMLDKLLASRNFQAGLALLRQLEFALFDFKLHLDYQPDAPFDVVSTLDQIRAQVAVVTPPPFNRFASAFSHIFAGGYAAGYYSYLWAEVLSADVFEMFTDEGVLNSSTGRRFLHCILERGGSREAGELFEEFRGRAPDVGALLRQRGLE
jgi:oligopeptidase A